VLFAAVTGMVACLLLTSCGGDKKPELHLYNWADYVDESVLRDFESRFDCRVVLDFFDSNESMYAKIKAGASGYDVIFPSSYQAAIMQEEGLLQRLDLDRIPNAANIDPRYLATGAIDKAMAYSVPYMTGTTGIGYSAAALPDLEPSWSVFLLPEVKNRATLLNDMRETLGAALKFLGYSLNTTEESEIAEAAEVVKQWKSNIAKFENEQYKPGIASGEFLLVHGYSGDISQVMEENEAAEITYMLPQEGFGLWCDDMVIPVDAPNPELAHAFINFMLEADISARNMEFCYYKAPNTAAYALISEELREDETVFVPEELMQKAEVIRPLGEHTLLFTRYWDLVKAAP
jgi:spermidine/putrescine transport system substrate-binding protein